jgi:hypothetical protein
LNIQVQGFIPTAEFAVPPAALLVHIQVRRGHLNGPLKGAHARRDTGRG